MVDCESLRYVSHAIVQLYPVKAKTKNCVATVVEFAGLDDKKPIKKFKKLLEELSLSDKTGMAVLKSFSAEHLLDFGNATRSGEVSISAATEAANAAGVEVCLEGRGIIGAVAALPFFSQSDESVKLDKILHEES
jgi:tRNA(Ile2) C34 agmatinyltransferase TiaS